MLKKYLNIIIGSFLISAALVFFLVPYHVISIGVFGLGTLMYYQYEIIPPISMFLLNVGCLLIAYFALKQRIKEYILPIILIPAFAYGLILTELVLFDQIETILAAVAGAFLTGVGLNLLYKDAEGIGGIEALQEAINIKKIYRTKTFTYAVEITLLITTLIILNFEAMIYSLIAIVIMRVLSRTSKIGTSTSKTFFIITDKEKEVKDYIMNELNHDLTQFDVKGGYSNNKHRIIMTVMDTKDYYALREGIKTIDNEAFISIIDSYEVINKNKTLNKD